MTEVLKWSQLCSVAHAIGAKENDGKRASAMKLRRQLLKAIAEGKAEQIARGRYRFLPEREQK